MYERINTMKKRMDGRWLVNFVVARGIDAKVQKRVAYEWLK